MSKSKPGSLMLPPGLALGNNSAEEDDDFLFECFVRTSAYEQLTSFESSKMIAAGRTGAGKTAILRLIKQEYGKTSAVDPFDISLAFIANSDILNFLHSVGADLDLLFQVLWKHVLCTEYIRLRYGVKDSGKWASILTNLQGIFGGNPKRQKAVEYLRNFEGKFWVPVDENIKEVADKVTKKLEAEFSGDYERLKSKVHYERGVSSEKKAEIIARCKKIVTPEQLQDLSQLVELLADDDHHQGKYFILIDRLDENWIEDSLRFRMIRALIEALRGFRRIRRLKIVVALRSDVLERVLQETQALGFQKEKYQDYICDIKWTKAQLRQLISERIELMARRRIGGRALSLHDVLAKKIGRRDPFDYIVERTLNRPRDLLSFFNLGLQNAAGKSEIAATVVRESEREYSLGRYGALVDEWKGAFPYIASVLSFAAQIGGSCTFSELCASDKLDGLILSVTTETQQRKDLFYQLAERALANEKSDEAVQLLRTAFDVLYRIGAIGIKPKASDRFVYSHIDMPLLSPGLLTGDTRIRIHPMLQRALNVPDCVDAADRAA